MRLTMKQRQAVTAVTVQRYRQSSKKVKQQILDEFCETTGYCRGYARYVLRNQGRQVWLGGKRTIVGAVCQRQQRLKPRVYDEPVLAELRKLWELLNYVCGKRLVAIMPELIAKLEQFGELRLSASTKEKLLRISAATVDRLLQPERRKQQLRRRAQTKPALYSNTRSRFVPLPNGMSNSLVLWKWIWWPMMVVWRSATTAKHLT